MKIWMHEKYCNLHTDSILSRIPRISCDRYVWCGRCIVLKVKALGSCFAFLLPAHLSLCSMSPHVRCLSLYVHCVANTSFIHEWLYFIYRIYLEFRRFFARSAHAILVVVFSLIIIIFSYLFFMLARTSENRFGKGTKVPDVDLTGIS